MRKPGRVTAVRLRTLVKRGRLADRSAGGATVGAGDGNRTHDIQLGKLSFYH
jgi:hypothetical protein